MTLHEGTPGEFDLLLEALCEDRLTAEQLPKLERLVLASPEARRKYLTYLELHGTLYWDAAGVGSADPLNSVIQPAAITAPAWSHRPAAAIRNRGYPQIISAMAACLILGIAGIWHVSRVSPPSVKVEPVVPVPDETIRVVGTNHVRRTGPRVFGPPVSLAGTETSPQAVGNSVDSGPDQEEPAPAADGLPVASVQEITSKIDEQFRSGWKSSGIEPSAKADDSEWMRRIYLDLLGRIPTVAEAEAFLASNQPRKREDLVSRLLGDSAYARNFTTKWTNLLIGRSTGPQVDRDAFRKFLRISFAENHPWNQIVADLISAEGNNVEHGAANFLIAHLNNDATPATAIVAKLFLGQQVQCNQCHNNPFNDSKQVAFWELNSFFQQTTTITRQRRDPRSGRLDYVSTDLVTQDVGGPTYFESHSGLMRVAYPIYHGRQVDASPDTNRRRELARLMTTGRQPDLAAAFVNRMWEHFFGYGFTRNVDDLGAHQPVSHPELLATLSDQFVRSGYDIRQLIRWICLSEVYQLSCRVNDTNDGDDPALGELPAFSHHYVRQMSPEQTYDSFLTATKANQVGAVDWTQAEKNRQEWLQQFVVAFHTDENDEATTFEGSLANAISMMNGPLISKALDLSAGSFLGEVVRKRVPDNEKIRLLCLAVWSRYPTASEQASMRKMIREAELSRPGRENSAEGFQDLFWALLNSNEFVLVR